MCVCVCVWMYVCMCVCGEFYVTLGKVYKFICFKESAQKHYVDLRRSDARILTYFFINCVEFSIENVVAFTVSCGR